MQCSTRRNEYEIIIIKNRNHNNEDDSSIFHVMTEWQ